MKLLESGKQRENKNPFTRRAFGLIQKQNSDSFIAFMLEIISLL